MIENIIQILKKCLVKKKGSYHVHEPQFPKSTIDSLKKCIKSTFVSTKGENIEKFTNQLKKITKSNYVLLTSSGTAALFMGLKQIDINNCEIIVPSMTFVATSNSIVHAGGIPHFVDCEKNDLNIDPVNLEKHLADTTIIKKNICYNKKTKKVIKAIIIVHAYGYPANVAALTKLAKKYKLIVMEDAAGAIGSTLNNKHLGTYSRIGILSFNGNKTITTGMGGAMLFKNKNDYLEVKHLISTAKVPHNWKIIHDLIGFNLRMSNINASLGYEQAKDIKRTLKMKKKVYLTYQNAFYKNKYCDISVTKKDAKPNYWLTNIFLKEKYKKYHQKLIKELHKNNIFVRELWTPQHLLPMYKTNPKSSMRNTINHWKRGFSLPSSDYK